MKRLVCLLLLASAAHADKPLLQALQDELARAPKLQLPGVAAPYYVAYQAIDRVEQIVGASLGTLVSNRTERERYLRTDIRVGDASLDSSNVLGSMWGGGQEIMQVEDDYFALRHEIWSTTDRAYKQAVERLEKKKAALKGAAANPDRVGDFTTAQAAQYTSTKQLPAVDAAKLADLVAKASAVWKPIPELQEGTATANVTTETRLLVNTEGSVVTEPRQLIRFVMTIEAQASDGMRLAHQFVALTPSLDTLSEAELVATAKRMADELVALTKTTPGEEYAGPILFEPQAAAQLLRALLVPELSGTPPQVSGERMAEMAQKGSALGDKIGKRIVPLDFRIEDDPTIDKLDGKPLVGGYAFDDEAVKAQKVTLVDKGLLKTLLMSRAPRKSILASNGHGRAGLAGEARGAPSNLIVTATGGVAPAELKRRLLARARADGLTYAIIIKQLEEPGLSRNRQMIFFGNDAPKLPRPLVVVKVGLDGKETPVRGLAFGIMPLRALRAISGAGKDRAVLSWYASGGRESATTPVSLASPALLFDDLELVKDTATQPKPPTLPRL